jgi:FkbM family methyltransferase
MDKFGALLGTNPFSISGRILRSPFRLVPKAAVVPVLSGVNAGMRWIAGSHIAGCWLGTYEREKQRILSRLVAPGAIAYDIGAQAGFFTLALSRLTGSQGHVFAFEPDPQNASALRRHVAINGLKNVSIIQAAVSADNGLIGFHGSSATSRISDESKYMVPSISLDQFVKYGFPVPDVVKMDIEGAEVLALNGATSILERKATKWLIDTHGDDLFAACRSILAGFKYDLGSFSDRQAADIVALPDAGDLSVNRT